jgi:hypothetical protein
VGVGVDFEGKSDQHDLEDERCGPCREVGDRGRGLGVEQRDEEQAVDEEGANEVDLVMLVCRPYLNYYLVLYVPRPTCRPTSARCS